MEGEEGTNQQGCSKFYHMIQTMCRIVPVLILPFLVELGDLVWLVCFFCVSVLLVPSPSQYVGEGLSVNVYHSYSL